ncbi:hypothetical protein [Pararobbsia silviterrae]|uniref:hypothetical protein n=1 Tax=Pararobbsia silviterrae TaxID=1792498 RepID=UPI0011C4155B|nr:hypothetical protein [Pararobbsia silviterrae]
MFGESALASDKARQPSKPFCWRHVESRATTCRVLIGQAFHIESGADKVEQSAGLRQAFVSQAGIMCAGPRTSRPYVAAVFIALRRSCSQEARFDPPSDFR